MKEWVVCVAISTVAFIYFFYRILRPLIKVTVNCWFCNENSRVSFNERHSFVCPRCGQYNGFTEDGGYDRDIPEQRNECLNPAPPKKKSLNRMGSQLGLPSILAHNGLCHQCNAQQNLIQAQINKFEPRNEKNFFDELKQYKDRLYRTYPLCSVCEKYTQMKVQLDKEKLGLPDRVLPSRKASSVYSALSTFSPSQISFATTRSQFCENGLVKNPSKKRRRYYYAHFNSGPLANVLNIFTFMISILLFLSYFVQLYNDADIELINVSAYLPNFVLSSLIPQTLPYSAKLSMAALVAHLLSLKVSRTRRSLPDLVALVLWSALVYLKWREPTKDVILCQLGLSSVLTVIAFAVTFLPRKLLHRKKPNYIIQSAFSIASTPISQCSTASTRSSPNNISTLNCSMDRTSNSFKDFGQAPPSREGTPSRELGRLLSGLSLGEGEKKLNNRSPPSLRRRGPFDSMKRPVLTPSRLRIGDQQRCPSNMFSSRYVPSGPPSIMTSVSQAASPTQSFTLINWVCALIALSSVFINLFMLYKISYMKHD
uniref:Transmembrane protein 201 n=1 Tax=Ascaris suum TaxID=6253 RepID=F1L404_ASCSU